MENPESEAAQPPVIPLSEAEIRRMAQEWFDQVKANRQQAEAERQDREVCSLRAVGRPRVNYGRPEIDKIVRLIAAGHGRISACAELGIGYRSFHRHLKANPDVAAELRLAERLRLDRCSEVVYRRALSVAEPAVYLRAAMFFLNRQDRLDAARLARREKAERAQERAEAE